MTSGTHDRVVPRPASTVALLRSGATGAVEVLLTHRPSTMAFGPGLHVFPGGAVDADDPDGALAARSALDGQACAVAWAFDLSPGAAIGHAMAAIRELHEEAGVLLATGSGGVPIQVPAGEPIATLVNRLDLTLRTDWLVPLSRWVTPPIAGSRRYDTRFFVAWLPDGAEVAHHRGEVVAHEWLTPATALDRYASGAIDLWPPTSTTLAQLAGVTSLADVRRELAPVRAASPAVVTDVTPGLVRVRLGSGGGIPGRAADAWIVGRERVVVVDPGDPTEEGMDAILGTVSRHGATIAAIAVTSAAPDRVAGAVGLALVAGVPLWASSAAAPRIGDEASVIGDAARILDGDTELLVEAARDARDGGIVLRVPSMGIALPPGGDAGAWAGG